MPSRNFAAVVGLAIALDVERAGNDLALLLRQRADFLSAATAATAAAADIDVAGLKFLSNGRMRRK